MMTKYFVLMVGLLLGGVISGAGVVLAGVGPLGRAGGEAVAASGSAKKLCLFAFETRTDPLEVGGGGVTAGKVQAKKSCPGPVSGRFSTEVFVAPDGTLELGAMRATCVGSGGLNDPCALGQEVFADPGPTPLVVNPSSDPVIGTHGMEAVWPSLKRGIWVFEVGVYGTTEFEEIDSRTFTVNGHQ